MTSAYTNLKLKKTFIDIENGFLTFGLQPLFNFRHKSTVPLTWGWSRDPRHHLPCFQGFLLLQNESNEFVLSYEFTCIESRGEFSEENYLFCCCNFKH